MSEHVAPASPIVTTLPTITILGAPDLRRRRVVEEITRLSERPPAEAPHLATQET